MRAVLTLIAATLAATPAAAEVTASSDTAFTIKHSFIVEAPVERVWEAVIHPERWWSGAHSYSGDAANISLAANAGGCWCEKLPGGGSVEHMRVVNVQPGKLIRMAGGLGPLQSLPVNAVMTISLKSEGGSTRLTLTYMVAGAAGLGSLSAPVDQVIGQQMPNLEVLAAK